MGERIIIDPITRIEGHLKIEVEVENGVVTNAWSTGTMARGIEVLLQDKDPRDAPYVCSRICGVCQGVHSIASAHALDNAFDVDVPEAGRIMRNLNCSGQYMGDHYIHFYVLSALDYLDIMAVASYSGNDPGLLAIKDKISYLASKNDTSPFTPRYEPDEYCVNDPEIVTTLVSHYIKAIEMKAKSMRMLAIITGIQTHPNTIMVGGCLATPTVEQLREFKTLWDEQVDFVNNVYIPDVTFVGTGPLLPLATAGLGGGLQNYLCYPMFPQNDSASNNDRPFGGRNHLFKGGAIIGGALNTAENVDYSKITESVKHSWYDYPDGVDSLHPSEGETNLNPRKDDAYSFVKAPRYKGQPMEVGPLSRGLVNQYPGLMALVEAGVKPGAVARHYCRAIESQTVGEAGFDWIERLTELAVSGTVVGMKEKAIPKSASGFGVWDAPRGALGHWVEIENGRTKNYQIVVPSTWNASPRDENDAKGPYEESLIGCPVPDVDNPIN
ncbi:MAG: nickel-dependent hydrogenase large subunit, partial [Dehalococcoidales bacterium]|nr:nickel-dependent hydrogenase large subunit [Dehalococcoidales bacterium]